MNYQYRKKENSKLQIIHFILLLRHIGKLENYPTVEFITSITVRLDISYTIDANNNCSLVSKTTTWTDPRIAGPVCHFKILMSKRAHKSVQRARISSELLYSPLILL